MNRYQYVPITSNPDTKVKYYKNSKYPEVPVSPDDIYVIIVFGDRLDLLANQYYKDPSLWWVISIANEFLTQGSLYLTPGTQLRIPYNLTNVMDNFNALNNVGF